MKRRLETSEDKSRCRQERERKGEDVLARRGWEVIQNRPDQNSKIWSDVTLLRRAFDQMIWPMIESDLRVEGDWFCTYEVTLKFDLSRLNSFLKPLLGWWLSFFVALKTIDFCSNNRGGWSDRNIRRITLDQDLILNRCCRTIQCISFNHDKYVVHRIVSTLLCFKIATSLNVIVASMTVLSWYMHHCNNSLLIDNPNLHINYPADAESSSPPQMKLIVIM